VPSALTYRLLQVSDFDPAELARIDLRGAASHDAVVERIQRHSMGWSWTHQQVFGELGVDCRTVIPASTPARRLAAMAASQVPADRDSSGQVDGALAYVLEAVGRLQPQVVFLDNPAFLDAVAIARLRALPAPPLLVTHFCAALQPAAEATLALHDLVLCCSPHFVARAAALGATAQLHYHAAPAAALALPLPPLESRLQRACFIGSIVPGGRYHDRRQQLLRQVCHSGVPLDLYSAAPRPRLLAALRRRRGEGSRLVRGLEGLHRQIAARSSLQRALRPPVYGAAMFDTMQHHLCALNVHAGMAAGYAANMRLFEAAALGVCLISEDHPNLTDLFEPGSEILTYRSARELIVRLRHCLAHPEETAAIGERARQRALACHTYRHRVVALHTRVLQLLEGRR